MSAGLRHIAVVGAGPSGLAIALMLARQGRRIVVHERFDAPRPVGAGFLLQPTGLHVLDQLGLTGRIAALGQPVTRLFGRAAPSYRTVLDVRYADLKRPRTALGVHRAALFQVQPQLGLHPVLPGGWTAAAVGARPRAGARRPIALRAAPSGGDRLGPDAGPALRRVRTGCWRDRRDPAVPSSCWPWRPRRRSGQDRPG